MRWFKKRWAALAEFAEAHAEGWLSVGPRTTGLTYGAWLGEEGLA